MTVKRWRIEDMRGWQHSPTESKDGRWVKWEDHKAVAEDAARYRWLKEHHLQLGPDCWIRTGDDLDDAIDAERRADQVGDKS